MSNNTSEWEQDNSEKTEKKQETADKPSFDDEKTAPMERKSRSDMSRTMSTDDYRSRPSYDRRPSYPRDDDRRPMRARRDDDEERLPSRGRRDDDRFSRDMRDEDRFSRTRRDEDRFSRTRRDEDRFSRDRRDDDMGPRYISSDEDRYSRDRRGDSGYSKRRDSYDDQPPSRYRSYGSDRYDSRGRDDYYEKRPRQQREDPLEPNVTIGIFNLSYNLTQRDFEEFLSTKLADYQDKFTSKLIMCNETGRCKGYGFVTFTAIEDSISAKPILEDGEIHGQKYRVAFSIQRRNNDRRHIENSERPAFNGSDNN